MKFQRFGTLVASGGIAVLAAVSPALAQSPAESPAASGAAGGTAVKIGIELPMTGGEAPNGVPTANGVALAL